MRDHETQLERMIPLRAQYAEDVSRLAMLAEAHTLFDPLGVLACPACLNTLSMSSTAAGRCFLCQSPGRPPRAFGARWTPARR